MENNDLIDTLLNSGDWGNDNFLIEPESLKEYLVDILDEYFDTFYSNQEDYDGYKRIDLPEAYIQFLVRSQLENARFGGPYGMGIWGWPTMLYRTLNWSGLYVDEEPERLWISIAERGDKGYIFMCCDAKSPLFGTVVEFYDGTPWIKGSALPEPDDKEDSDVYGTFTEFMQHTLDNFCKQ